MGGICGSILVYFHFLPFFFGQIRHFIKAVSDLFLELSDWFLVAFSKLTLWDGVKF
jgi:hypothetical protein